VQKLIIGAALAALLIPATATGAQLPKVSPGPLIIHSRGTVRPRWFTPTGDGSLYFGGRLRSDVRRRGGFGKVRWLTYNQTEAIATGLAWSRFSPGKYNQKAYVVQGTVRVRLYDPVDGVFRRGRYTEHFSRNPQFVIKRWLGKIRSYALRYEPFS
jgi:hypothetical protein